MSYRLVGVAILCVVWFGLIGCGGGRTKVRTVSVSGTVQMDGKALGGAEVNFVGEQYAGIATTGSDGTYQLDAQPGENKVFIRKFPENFDPTLAVPGETKGATKIPGQLLPERYSDPARSELKFPVPENAATGADFALKSK